MANFSIIGAGLTGATLARDLAEKGHKILVLEKAAFVGGLCADRVDPLAGVPVSTYGPHIFHTDDDDIVKYVARFGALMSFDHQVENLTDAGMLEWPINLNTIESVYGSLEQFRMELASFDGVDLGPETFETKALRMVGRKLYHLTIKSYTEKQWGVAATEVPAEVLGRIPIKLTRSNRFFPDEHVLLPIGGYSSLIESMLDHPRIMVRTANGMHAGGARTLSSDFVIATVDPYEFVSGATGAGTYRNVDFTPLESRPGFNLTHAVVNYGSESVPYTRTTDYGKMYGSTRSIMVAESSVSESKGVKAYPVRNERNLRSMGELIKHIEAEYGVIMAGRLGSFRYLDMDDAIIEAKKLIEERGW